MEDEFKCNDCGKTLKRGETTFKNGEMYCKDCA